MEARTLLVMAVTRPSSRRLDRRAMRWGDGVIHREAPMLFGITMFPIGSRDNLSRPMPEIVDESTELGSIAERRRWARSSNARGT